MTNELIVFNTKKKIQGETFIDIPFFPRYQISNYGRVYSNITKKFLKPTIVSGRLKVILRTGCKEKLLFWLDVLVAKSFIPNTNNYQYVYHKDNNLLNVSIDNLEWISSRNMILENKTIYDKYLKKNRSQVQVNQYDISGNYLRTLWVYDWNIIKVCFSLKNPKFKSYHTAYGYMWRFTTDQMQDENLSSYKKMYGREFSERTKKYVARFEIQTNRLLGVYVSINRAAKECSSVGFVVDKGKISKCLRGQLLSAYDSEWKYL